MKKKLIFKKSWSSPFLYWSVGLCIIIPIPYMIQRKITPK